MTGTSAEQAWADLAFNPTNVPREVPTRQQRFMPLEPIICSVGNERVIYYRRAACCVLRKNLSDWRWHWSMVTLILSAQAAYNRGY